MWKPRPWTPRRRASRRREAAKRLERLGPAEPPTSRSTASIVAGNVFTLFNAIIGGFFILILSLGLFADAFFGFVAIVNSAIGIRQELKAKKTLDELALLVAPRAKAIRDGSEVELRAEEIVPGDIVRVEPGDQLVADGVVVSSRGLTIDESLLTGESDGIRKREGDRVLSGSFCLSGSGYYEVDAVREHSYAEKLAGEARQFRSPPSPLQVEVNQVLKATTIAMIPLAIILLLAFAVRSVEFEEAVQTATAGLITLIPEGLVLLMSVTLAVAAVRLARMNTLVQQMSATEALAAVDTICIDKTGTLTDGSLELVAVEAASEPAQEIDRALAAFAASAGERNRTLQTIADHYLGEPRRVVGEVPFSSEWKWSGLELRNGGGATYVLGAPDVLAEAGALDLPPALRAKLEEHTSAGRRVVAFGEAEGPLPGDPASAAAAEDSPAGAGRARGAAAPRRRRDDRVHARAEGRPEADLRRRAPDRDGGRPRGRGAATTPGSSRAPTCRPTAPASPRPRSATRSSAASAPSRRRPWWRRSTSGDGPPR